MPRDSTHAVCGQHIALESDVHRHCIQPSARAATATARRRARGYMVEERSHPESESRPPVRAAASVQTHAAQRSRVSSVASCASQRVPRRLSRRPQSRCRRVVRVVWCAGQQVAQVSGGTAIGAHRRSRCRRWRCRQRAVGGAAIRGGLRLPVLSPPAPPCATPSGPGGPAYLEAELRGLDRSHVATRTTADHDEVVRLCGGGRRRVCVGL